MSKHKSTPLDVHIGECIRQFRLQRGATQTNLADAISVTFQQVQKYENGTHRVSASTLHDIARTLGVVVSVFFLDWTGDRYGKSRLDTAIVAPRGPYAKRAPSN